MVASCVILGMHVSTDLINSKSSDKSPDPPGGAKVSDHRPMSESGLVPQGAKLGQGVASVMSSFIFTIISNSATRLRQACWASFFAFFATSLAFAVALTSAEV